MDQDFTQIAFLLTVITVTVLLLVLLVVNLLLGSRNRKLKHHTELLMLESRQKEELAVIRAEVTEATLTDVARDLHDEVGQLLTFSVLQLENLSALPEAEKVPALNEIKLSVREALESIRSITRGMSADFVSDFGFVASLEMLLERVTKRTQVKTHLEVSPGCTIHPSVNPIIIFRIIRECLTNAIRHGNATDIHIKVAPEGNNCNIIVTDNGKGFHNDPNEISGLGVKTMQHYATLIGGELRFSNGTQTGTVINLSFPNHP
jgi:two-component system NarL family sensor kinase